MRSSSPYLYMVIIILLSLMFIASVYANRMRDEGYDHPILSEVRTRFSKLDPSYAEIPLKQGHESYTDNKAAITLCLRNPDTRKYYKINDIMYVALHELSHIVTPTYDDHGPMFKKNFNELLKKADKVGVYNISEPAPTSYCGVGP